MRERHNADDRHQHGFDSEQDVPSAIQDDESFLSRPSSRRSFLKGASASAALALAGHYAVDAIARYNAKNQSAHDEEAIRDWQEGQSHVLQERESGWEAHHKQVLAHLEKLHSALDDVSGADKIIAPGALPSSILDTFYQEAASGLQNKTVDESRTNLRVDVERVRSYFEHLTGSTSYRQVLPELASCLEDIDVLPRQNDSNTEAVFCNAKLAFLERQALNCSWRDNILGQYQIAVGGESAEDFFRGDVAKVHGELEKIPPFVLRDRAKIKSITFATAGLAINSTHSGGDASDAGEIRIYPGNEEWATLHEVTHVLAGQGLKSAQVIRNRYTGGISSEIWREKVNFGRSYPHKTGSESIEASAIENKNTWRAELARIYPNLFESETKVVPPGYALPYGWEGGVREDEATVSQVLFDSVLLKRAVCQAANDSTLKRKLEIMTGFKLDRPFTCVEGVPLLEMDMQARMTAMSEAVAAYEKIASTVGLPVPFEMNEKVYQIAAINKDVKKIAETFLGCKLVVANQFGSYITDEEYKTLGYPVRPYWSSWSVNYEAHGDKNYMVVFQDANYYNQRLAGNKIIFNETSGRTYTTPVVEITAGRTSPMTS